MDGSTLIFPYEQMNRYRARELDRENRILRSIADRGVVIPPERPQRPIVHALAGAGAWFRDLFSGPRRPSVA
ncbi:MAG TPA: hypothetical protein VJU58_12365 [Microbacterium sp.]|nr:hypothetical protein [Microbacterium sp.]